MPEEITLSANSISLKGTEYAVQRVPLNLAASGDNQVVAADSTHAIQVVGGHLSFSGTVNAKFTDGAAGSLLAGLFYGVADTQVPLGFNPTGHFKGSINKDLTMNLSGAVAVGGFIDYILLPY